MATMKVDLGDSGVVHAIQTSRGVMFSMSEISSTIFHENPSAFAKFDLVPILKVALMKMVTQQSATLMAQGNLEDALSLALDAIKQAQNIFYPKAPLQLVPLYLLAVQVCISLGRTTQCQELLGIAAWLFLQGQEGEENHETQAEISRLFGQLYVLQNKLENALQAFAEEIYYVSKEHGVLDIRTSIGFYNTFKVLKTLGRFDDCLAFGDVVAETWLLIMGGLVLNETRIPSWSFGDLDPEITPNLKNSQENIQWVHINDVVCMLQDILELRKQVLGVCKANADEVFLTVGLLYLYKQDFNLSLDNLNKAKRGSSKNISPHVHDMIESALLLIKKKQLK